ncbi:MAG: EAL domain-containing protein [Sphingomonadales bacterium]|nr:EAL domain-containing protein [Sphingomonadales bacterium]
MASALCAAIAAHGAATSTAAARRLAAAANSRAATSLGAAVGAVEAALGVLGHRLGQAHPVSGLPTRETIIAQMQQAESGVLGLFAVTDLARLTAFDPALADRIVGECKDRLRKMLPADRPLCQVDRGHFAVWYGDAEQQLADAAMEAAAYALGDDIAIDGRSLTPQVAMRLTRFDRTEGVDPAAFLHQAIALLSLPGGHVAESGPAVAVSSTMVRERFALEQDLRHAIDRHELRLEYQPLVDAERGQVIGAEALLRWDHPVRGAVGPAAFIPVVEAAGLAEPIGLWVFNAAVREAKAWQGLGAQGLRVAVNVSALQLRQAELPTMILRLLQHHCVPPAALEIELTESLALDDAADCRRIFGALRRMGVSLAVDDFGTGYSGFGSLRSLAFDKIKIDRQFVTDVDVRRDSQAICQSILALGRGLGIRVLAEGVERHEEYAWLRSQGCRHFQGYYFGRPMPAEAFRRFIGERERLAELLGLEQELLRIEARKQQGIGA